MIEDFEEKVPYTKRPLSIKTQVAKLEKRGLIIDDENLAGDYLSNISYYRLRAYTYHFQNKSLKFYCYFLYYLHNLKIFPST